MPTTSMSDHDVEMKIASLNRSEMVRLARKERSLKMKRRKYPYDLQWLERRGQELAAAGIDLDNIEAILFGEEE